MDIRPLLEVFDKALYSSNGFPLAKAEEILRASLNERGRFDPQDEALIEAILRDGDRLFEKSFAESVEGYKSGLPLGEVFGADESHAADAVRIFIGILENLINYYYSAMIRGQL
ncbi:MAG: hypothetical protein ACT4NX_07525 [Deltaproteobacteria bacterium]